MNRSKQQQQQQHDQYNEQQEHEQGQYNQQYQQDPQDYDEQYQNQYDPQQHGEYNEQDGYQGGYGDYDPNQEAMNNQQYGQYGEEDEQQYTDQNQRNQKQYAQQNRGYGNQYNNHQQYRPESNRSNDQVDPQQLTSIKDLVGKLNSTEARINSLKSELQTKNVRVENKQKEVKDFSQTLLEQIRQNPISRKPGLEQDIHQGVEIAMVEAGATIQRLKMENNELKEVIKTKNKYIETIQENYRNMKKAYEDKCRELDASRNTLDYKNVEVDQMKRKIDNEVKVNALRENIRVARTEGQQAPKKMEAAYVDGIQDDYDFWKTSNDQPAEPEYKEAKTNAKLDNMFQGQNKLFIQDNNKNDINFDSLKFSSQKR